MKRALIIVLSLAALVVAAPASAATPAERKIAALQKQVRALSAQVKLLRAQVSFVRQEVAANYVGDACSDAVTATLFQSTWATIDGKQPSPWFNPTPTISDRRACSSIGVTRPAVQTPPALNVFNDIIRWLIG